MERDKEKPAHLKPLLLKIAVPIALSLAGIIISTLKTDSTTPRRRRKSPSNISSQEEDLMGSPRCSSNYEFGDEDGSIILDSASLNHHGDHEFRDIGRPLNCDDKEKEEEPAGEPSTSIHHQLISTREIYLEKFHDGSNLEEEIDGLKDLVNALQDRECEHEAQFYDYCNAKEQESAFQKLQIMCLGLKLESLESQNHRHEGGMAELREVMEQLDLMRAEVELLRRKVKKLSRVNRKHSRVIQKQAMVIQTRDAEMLRDREELKRITEETRELAGRLHDERRSMEEKVELPTSMVDPSTSKSEGGMMVEELDVLRLRNQNLLDQLERLRDQWSSYMEELVYLGWINECLRHELQINQEVLEEKGPELEGEIRDELVLEHPIDEQGTIQSIELYDSKSRVDSKKPRLLHKLKGWAKGKGKGKGECY